MLRDVTIAGVDWEATAQLAEDCFPEPSRGVDEAATVALGREFLRVLMLAAVSHGRPDLEYVRRLVDMELARPGSAVDEAALAARPSAGLAALKRV